MFQHVNHVFKIQRIMFAQSKYMLNFIFDKLGIEQVKFSLFCLHLVATNIPFKV